MQPRHNNIEKKGVGHIIAATGYSMAGLRFLLTEEAARLEIILMAVALVVFLLVGAPLVSYPILAVIFMLLLCVEALNSAIELIVDRTSPEISEFGKHTKDLGSFAVFCMLTIFSLYSLSVVFFTLF